MNTDPISDLLTRIRNAQKAGHATTKAPGSKLKLRLAELLKEEGYLADVQSEGEGPGRKIVIKLKYDGQRKGVIEGIERVSSPGLRIYKGHAELPQVRGGMGMSVVSTSRGLLADRDARTQKLGGEVICNVW